MTVHSDSSAQLGAPGPVESAPAASSRSQTFRAVREIVETLLLAALIFFLVRLVVLNFRVDGQSMTPNLDDGQMLLVNRNAYQFVDWQGNKFYPFDPPERGDIVVFNPPTESDKPYIKRIIGLPGDTIEVVGDTILINGEELPQPFVHNLNPEGTYFGPVIVPENSLFVMGDNRPRSSDSRAIGAIDEDLVVGKAWLRVWPLSEFGLVEHFELLPGASAESGNQ